MNGKEILETLIIGFVTLTASVVLTFVLTAILWGAPYLFLGLVVYMLLSYVIGKEMIRRG